jgi:F-type H+-transporting ATPase subunit delta
VIPAAVLGRYARSLADVVFEENLEPEVTGNLKTYDEIFRTVPDLLDAFHNPAIPRDAKEQLLTGLIAQYPIIPIASNFLRILLQHNRMLYFSQIFQSYLKAVNKRKGVVSAVVSTSSPMSQQELKNLAEKLADFTGKLVNIELKTDASLLGGVVVQVGNTIFDGSIRARLDEVKRRFSET